MIKHGKSEICGSFRLFSLRSDNMIGSHWIEFSC